MTGISRLAAAPDKDNHVEEAEPPNQMTDEIHS
jgi:hypothetical protein